MLTELLWDHKILSDVTGCRKTQVSDCTGSTVLPFSLICVSIMFTNIFGEMTGIIPVLKLLINEITLKVG
jgi:hypothetical protein